MELPTETPSPSARRGLLVAPVVKGFADPYDPWGLGTVVHQPSQPGICPDADPLFDQMMKCTEGAWTRYAM